MDAGHNHVLVDAIQNQLAQIAQLNLMASLLQGRQRNLSQVGATATPRRDQSRQSQRAPTQAIAPNIVRSHQVRPLHTDRLQHVRQRVQ